MEDGVAVTKKAQRGDVGGVTAHIDDRLPLRTGRQRRAFKLAVRRALAAHQAGSGRGAVDGSGFCNGSGDLGVSVDVQIIVSGEVEIFFAGNKRGGLGARSWQRNRGCLHPHLGSHFYKSIKGELGTRAG